MVTKYGMSENIGVINYNSDDDEVFIGRDLAHAKSHSELISGEIDREVKSIIDDCYDKAKRSYWSIWMCFMAVQSCSWKRKRLEEMSLKRCLQKSSKKGWISRYCVIV